MGARVDQSAVAPDAWLIDGHPPYTPEVRPVSLRVAVEHCIERLRRFSIGNGCCVAIWRVPLAQAIPLLFAVPSLGAVPVWLNDRWSPAETLRALQDCDADYVLVGDNDETTELTAVSDEKQKLRRIDEVTSDLVPSTDIAELSANKLLSRLLSWVPVQRCSSIRTVQSTRFGHDRESLAREIAMVFYTSGSTGNPKGVVLSHDALLCQAKAKIEHVGYSARTRYIHLAPLFHLGGASSSIAVALAGGGHIVPGAKDSDRILKCISTFQVNTLVVVPAVLQLLVDRAVCCQSVETILYGGGSLTHAQRAMAYARFPRTRLIGAYGMTETASSMTFVHHANIPADSDAHASVGKPPRHVQLRIGSISPDAFSGVTDGGIGEIQTCGEHVMNGYLGRDDETREVLSSDGWFSTGDVGKFDSNGNLFLVGRLKDMIKTGGENVFAGEVEAVLSQHPAVVSTAVVGIPHRILGEAVAAAVIVRSEVDGIASLKRWCREQLSSYKRPKWIIPMRHFPSNSVGKVVKPRLREQIAEAVYQRGKL